MFLVFLLIITKKNLVNNIIILMCALVVWKIKVRTNKKKEEEINYQELIMSFAPSLLR